MDILSTTITQLNSLIAETGLFSKLYGLCQLERDAQGKATQKIIEYQSSGQGKPITDYDSENGTLAWLMRSAISIAVAPANNKVTSNDEVITITFPLRAIAVVNKEELACDNSTAGDQIAQTLIKKLQGQNVAIKTLIKARSFRVEAANYTTDVKEIAKNYNWATLQMDFNVVIVTSKECLPDVCGTLSTSPCAFSIDLINSDGVLIFELSELSNNPFTLPDQPVVDGNGNTVNAPYDPDTPFVTEACSVICDDATAVLKDTLGATISTTNIPSGASQDITAPDTTGVVKNSLGTTISSTNIPSGSSDDLLAPDATAVLKDTDGSILLTEPIPSNVSEDLTAPDGSVTVNSVAFDTVLSGGSLDVEVRQELTATQVGSKQGQFWRIADSDITVNGSAFASVGAEDSLDVKVEYENGTPVGTIVGDTVEIPDVIQDLVTKVNFETGATLDFDITIDSDTAGTYTANTFGGSTTSATYEVNSVAATLPFTVVATDVLTIFPDADNGFVRLTGTY